MAASLDVTGGLLLAEQATTGLRERLGHAAAKDLVTAAASTAQDEHRPFADVLAEALAGLENPPADPAAEARALLDPAARRGRGRRARRRPAPIASGEPVSPHPSTEHWDPAGEEVRRAVLGDAHVDRAVANTDDVTADFQDFITRYAWGGIWTRPGLARRERSIVTLSVLAALHHDGELAMHVRAARRNGLTREEIQEVLLQVGVYAGVPAANRAFGVAQQVLAEEEPDG